MATIRTTWDKRLRVWGFDLEARPGPWGGGDFTFKHMLSIAAGYEAGPVFYLAPGFTASALEEIISPMRQGGIVVVGHNALRYDLPLLHGTMVKMGLEPLGPQLVSDTYLHLVKSDLAYSRSLGNMAERFGVQSKGAMSEFKWEQVYAGVPEYLDLLRLYNIGDVEVTLALYRILITRGLLKPPRRWTP